MAARNTYGGGTLTEVERGKRYRLRVVIQTNPLQQKTETFHGKVSPARERLAEMVADAKKSRGVPAADREAAQVAAERTVADLLVAWLTQVEPTHKASTIAEYRRLIDKALIPVLGQVRLQQLSGQMLDQQYAKWRKAGLADGSVKARHRILSAALHQGERWEWIESSPARRVRPLKDAQSKARDVPTVEQAGALLERAKTEDQVLYVLVLLAAITGARRGELVALRWSAVDLEAGLLNITGSLTEADIRQGKTHVPPKTKAGLRTVAVDSTTIDFLKDHQQWQADEAARLGVELAEDPYVLSYQPDRGTPAWPSSLGHAFKKLCEKLAEDTGDPYDFHLHLLRHYSATMLVSMGHDPVTVAHRLGHADPSVTLRLYSHAVPARDVAAAAALGALLPGDI